MYWEKELIDGTGVVEEKYGDRYIRKGKEMTGASCSGDWYAGRMNRGQRGDEQRKGRKEEKKKARRENMGNILESN